MDSLIHFNNINFLVLIIQPVPAYVA